jgi:hypothetical protein
VDHLYLDNTYLHPRWTFPPARDVIAAVVELVLAHPRCAVAVSTDNLGKEELLVAIALALGTPIVVRPDRLAGIRRMRLPDVFTDEPGAGAALCTVSTV